MLKAVDGSFEVPTAEAVTLFLPLSVGGSPCDFTLAPAQTPPQTRPTSPPLPHHLTHSATVHLPILGIDISTALPDTFLYMQQHAYARGSSHVARSIISRTILLSNVAQTNAKNISASCYSTVCGVHVCLHCRMDTPNT